MPFLLLDDATQEAQRRLQEFGQGLLQPLGQTIEQAGQTVQPGPQVVPPGAAIPNAQAATQRLQDFGSSLLQPLTQQAPVQIAEQPGGIQDITQRLQDHGQQVLNQATQQVQQAQTQLLQLPQQGQLFGPGAQDQAQQQAQNQVIQTQPDLAPGGDLRTFARQAAQKAGIDPDIFVRQIEQESGFNPTAKSPAGALGIAQFMPETARGVGVDPTDPYASLIAAAKEDAQKLAQYGGDWSKTLAAYNAGPGAVAQYGGVPPYEETQRYVQNILGGAKQAVSGAVQGAQQAVSNVLPAVSQFGDKQLTAAEAYAACGPAAAVRFAEMVGRNPTLREAADLAAQVGWTPGGGMAGLGSESALFDKMQIPHRMVGADWSALAKEAQSGNPVTISTPGHYFTADGYDPNTGAFHVGSSGTDLRGGAEWMTPDQMQARMGQLQGGMAVDNPQVPGASPLADPGRALRQGAGDLAQKAQQGLQDISNFVSPVTNFVGQQNQLARQGRAQAGLPEDSLLAPVDLSRPGANFGLDPYRDIVEQGIPSIVRGVQTGNVGDVLGGAAQTGLGAIGAAAGPAGPEARAGVDAVVAARDTAANQLQTLERVLDEPGITGPVRGELEDLATQQRGAVADLGQRVQNLLGGRMGPGPDTDITRQLGAASPMFAARLAGGVGGGLVGNVTTPPEASPFERALRIGALGVAGAAAPGLADLAAVRNPALDQTILENLRAGGLNPNVYQSQGRGLIGTAVDLSKQGMLSNPVTHITNAIGNTIELLRSPVALTLGGRPSDAAAGMAAVAKAIPEAGINAWRALGGVQGPTLGAGASTTRPWEPVFRLLGAADMFTRTLGEYQGMAERGSQLLRDAGMRPSDPGAANFLASHAQELYDAGTASGGRSVFQAVRDASSGLPFLDNMFRNYATWKEGLLNSPSLRDQALGALADFQIPFAGVPTRMVQIGLGRLPPVTQATGAVRAIRALTQGDIPAAQRAIGETALESMIQAQIANGIREGNIVGADDPDHPGGAIRAAGNWYNFNDLGAYALPFNIMASFADAAQKAGQAQPYTTDWDQRAAQTQAGFNASLKPFMDALPGMQLVHMLAALGQGGASGALQQQAQDTMARITSPGAGAFIENLMDPVARDINKQGVQSLWEYPQSRFPGLAELLPAKIDPTTGQVLEKRRTGPGILVGQENPDVESAITQEANRLKKQGYDVAAPKTYPQSVTIGGSKIPLKPDQQRAITEITGKMLGNFAVRLDQPAYQNASEDRKAKMMQAYINAADRARVSAAVQVLGRDEARRLQVKYRDVAGRLVNAGAPAPAPASEDLPFSMASSQHILDQLAGVR